MMENFGMNRKDVENMVYDIIEAADYDLAKKLKEETAEEPEFAQDFMNQLVEIAIGHLNKLS